MATGHVVSENMVAQIAAVAGSVAAEPVVNGMQCPATGLTGVTGTTGVVDGC